MLISVFPSLSPLILCFSVVLAVGIACLIRHHLLHRRDEEIFHKTTGKLSRRLGSFEEYFLASASGSNIGYLNTVLLLESRIKLDVGHLKTALLSERFPLLRMRVTVDHLNQPYFEEMEDP